MWSKRVAENKESCWKCSRDIEIGEEEWVETRHSGHPPQSSINPYYDLEYCLDCGEEKQKQERQKKMTEIQTILNECATELVEINQKETNKLTVEDYQVLIGCEKKIKKIIEEEKSWLETDLSAQSSFILTDCEYQIENLRKIKEFFSEQIKIRAEWLSKKGGRYKNGIRIPTKKCSHTNVVYEESKPYNWFCQECGEDNSLNFLKVLQADLANDIRNNYCQKHNLSPKELNKLSLFDAYNRLKFYDYSNQQEIREDFQKTEEYLQSFLKSKGINIDKQHRERERERERAKLQSAITNLENKPDKTPEEEAELDSLKSKLKDLDEKNNSSPHSYLPWIIGGGFLIVVLLLTVFIATRKKRTN